MNCPICKKLVEEPGRPGESSSDARPGAAATPRPRPSTFPFCSERCKLVDLGRWLDGKYQVPVVEEDGDESAYAES